MSKQITEVLATIEGEKTFATLVLWDDKVVEPPTSMRFMKGWKRDRVRSYCQDKGLRVAVLTRTERVARDVQASWNVKPSASHQSQADHQPD